MLAAQGFALLFQRAVDVHQAATVGADHLMRAGFLQRTGLVQHHGAGDVGHAHAEGATEPAAFALVVVLDTLDLAQLGEQGAAVQVRVHLAAGRAGRMQGHFGRCAGILELDLADVEQELGQLEGALGQRLGLLQRGRLVLNSSR